MDKITAMVITLATIGVAWQLSRIADELRRMNDREEEPELAPEEMGDLSQSESEEDEEEGLISTTKFDLDLLHVRDQDVPEDYAQAATWFRKSADLGNPIAQFNLGILYAKGRGVPQDYAEAYFWLDIAAAGKLDIADEEKFTKNRDRVASHLTPADLSRVQERARKWFEDHPAKPQ